MLLKKSINGIKKILYKHLSIKVSLQCDADYELSIEQLQKTKHGKKANSIGNTSWQ